MIGFSCAFFYGCSGWEAIVFCFSPGWSRIFVSTYIVVYSSSTSSCSLRIAATILVCVCVDGGVSSCSMHFALYLAFSCLLLIFCSMSKISTG